MIRAVAAAPAVPTVPIVPLDSALALVVAEAAERAVGVTVGADADAAVGREGEAIPAPPTGDPAAPPLAIPLLCCRGDTDRADAETVEDPLISAS